MYIATQRYKSSSGKIYQSTLIRESYREGGKVKKRTLANLSKLPDEVVNNIKKALEPQKEALKNPSKSVLPGAGRSSVIERKLQLAIASRNDWKLRLRAKRRNIQALMTRVNDLIESRNAWKEKTNKISSRLTQTKKIVQQLNKQIQQLNYVMQAKEAEITALQQKMSTKQEELNQCTQLLELSMQDSQGKDKIIEDLKKNFIDNS